jgi:hypothetical protein
MEAFLGPNNLNILSEKIPSTGTSQVECTLFPIQPDIFLLLVLISEHCCGLSLKFLFLLEVMRHKATVIYYEVVLNSVLSQISLQLNPVSCSLQTFWIA